jgi:hypothetical protein
VEPTSKGFSLFPNPASDRVYISGGSVAQWELYSVAGALISSGGPLDNQSISLVTQAAGPYILRLQRADRSWSTLKVIKK